MRLIGATWNLALVFGTIAVLVHAAFVLVKTTIKGDGIWSGLKKAPGMDFRDLH
jgi:hypothetical protein